MRTKKLAENKAAYLNEITPSICKYSVSVGKGWQLSSLIKEKNKMTMVRKP